MEHDKMSNHTGFQKLAKSQFKKCNNAEDYAQIRRLLKGYGFEKFYNEMKDKKIFKDGEITNYKNTFAQMVRDPKYKIQEYVAMKDFIMITCYRNPDHKLLTPRLLTWDSFNVLTLNKTHLPLLKKMKKIAENWAIVHRYKKPLFCFHCYPFNSVHTLHLHVTDLSVDRHFAKNNHNLPIDDVIKVLTEEID